MYLSRHVLERHKAKIDFLAVSLAWRKLKVTGVMHGDI